MYLDNVWTYGVVIICINTMLAWVRNISSFSFTYQTANFLMLMCVIIVCSYSIVIINANGIEASVTSLNPVGMWSMVGFSIYVYEGIGILMPVMQASACPD